MADKHNIKGHNGKSMKKYIYLDSKEFYKLITSKRDTLVHRNKQLLNVGERTEYKDNSNFLSGMDFVLEAIKKYSK